MMNTSAHDKIKSLTTNALPGVSVIIPYLNNHEEVEAIVQSILEQNYEGKVQIICIYNGPESSSQLADSTLQSILQLNESNYLKSPYSARNRGIELASGELIIFLDANCSIHNNWLKQGVNCFMTKKADMIAGRVDFDFEDEINAAKIVDSITSIQMRRAVEERQCAYTANLFVKKTVFDEIGLFEEGVRSGGDVRWTSKATNSGFTLEYCDKAVVYKKARSYKELYLKKIRTGKGYYYTWIKEENKTPWYWNLIRSLKPPSLKEYETTLGRKKFSVWVNLYLTGIVTQLSFLGEYFRNKFVKASRR